MEVSCFAEASRRVYVCLNGWGVGGADDYSDGWEGGRDGMGWEAFLGPKVCQKMFSYDLQNLVRCRRDHFQHPPKVPNFGKIPTFHLKGV